MTDSTLRTTVVGSYPQPGWLIDPEKLRSRLVPRVRTPEVWRVPPEQLEEAQRDATILALRDQERAGIDIVSDGEMGRESYSNHFSSALSGVDGERPHVKIVQDLEIPVPRIVGAIRRPGPVECEALRFAKANTDRPVKVTLPGPFSMAKQAYDEHYGDEEAVAMAFAEALNEEARDLEAAGADVIQFDDPWLRTDPDGAERFALTALERAIRGLTTTTAVHLCFGYGFVVSREKPRAYAFLEKLSDSGVNQVSIEAAQPHLDLGVLANFHEQSIILGVIDLSTNEVETPEVLAERIRRALPFVPAERLLPAPDCGMKYLTREAAFGKLCSLVEAAALVRREEQSR